MIKRVIRRLLWSAIVLLGASAVTFGLVHAVPADPVAAYAGPHADSETRDRIRRELRLDDPIWRQYVRYLSGLVRGDLGRSYITEESVASALWARFPVTLAVAIGGLAFWVGVGVPVGVLTARWNGGRLDRLVFLLSMVGISIPVFWLARLLQFHLAYRAQLFPVGGFVGWRHLLMPWLTIGLSGAGYYARLMHSNMLEVLGKDYIRTARAKGLPERVVLFKHALPNAILPVLTAAGMDTAALLGGSVFVETVFGLPGLGLLALQAVLNLDVPMIMGTMLFGAVAVVGANCLVDVIGAWLDPSVQPS